MNYGLYLLLVLVTVVGVGWMALSTTLVRRTLQTAVGRPRRRAVLVLVLAALMGTLDVVGLLLFAPESSGSSHPRDWPPGSILWLSWLLVWLSGWVLWTGKPLFPKPEAAPLKKHSGLRFLRLFGFMVALLGMTVFSWQRSLGWVRAGHRAPVSIPASTAASTIEKSIQEALEAMNFGHCYAAAGCTGEAMSAQTTARTCAETGGLGWRANEGDCMEPTAVEESENQGSRPSTYPTQRR